MRPCDAKEEYHSDVELTYMGLKGTYSLLAIVLLSLRYRDLAIAIAFQLDGRWLFLFRAHCPRSLSLSLITCSGVYYIVLLKFLLD